jgi:hypothetical protein
VRTSMLRPVTAILAAVALLITLVPLTGVSSTPAAAASAQAPWWEEGIGSSGSDDCTAFRELCFPIYNENRDRNITLAGGSSWIAQRVGGSQFFLRNTSLTADRGCLTEDYTGTGETTWYGGTVKDWVTIPRICTTSDRRAVWHLLSVPDRPGRYMLQNMNEQCIEASGHIAAGFITDCKVNNGNQWFQPQSKAQARLWATYAIGWAQSSCTTRGEDNQTCSFAPADATFDTSKPERLPNACNPADVLVGSPAAASKYTWTNSTSKTTSSTESTDKTFGLELSFEGGKKDVWKAGIKTSFALKYGSSMTDSASQTMSATREVPIPAGQFAWVYIPQYKGLIPGTYTFFKGRDWNWSHEGDMDLLMRTDDQGQRMIGYGWLVDYDPATFDCHLNTAVTNRDTEKPYISGYDQGLRSAPMVGDVLTVDPGGWVAPGSFGRGADMTFTYQWIRGDNEVLRGETGPTYTARPADAGKTLKVKIRATNVGSMPGYADSLATNPVLPAAAEPTRAPTATPTPTPSASPVAPAPTTPATTPTAAAAPTPDEEPAATTISTDTAADRATGRPAMTITVRADAPGFGGEVTIVRIAGDGTEERIGSLPIFSRTNRAVATTTFVLPDSVPAGSAEFVLRFTSTEPRQFSPSETRTTVDVRTAEGTSTTAP